MLWGRGRGSLPPNPPETYQLREKLLRRYMHNAHSRVVPYSLAFILPTVHVYARQAIFTSNRVWVLVFLRNIVLSVNRFFQLRGNEALAGCTRSNNSSCAERVNGLQPRRLQSPWSLLASQLRHSTPNSVSDGADMQLYTSSMQAALETENRTLTSGQLPSNHADYFGVRWQLWSRLGSAAPVLQSAWIWAVCKAGVSGI
jgi:hypothetical protein